MILKKGIFIWGIFGLIVIGAVLWGPIVSNVEQAKYTIVEAEKNIEIRSYSPMMVAEAEVADERRKAISQGFRMIADYIFGNNTKAEKVSMTAPVIQQESEKIAMTAPVIQQGGGNMWKVRFVMPSGYTIESLPKPNNPGVKIRTVPGKNFAVIRFSGLATDEELQQHMKELNAFIEGKKLKVLSSPTYAFYNPPWTLPFLRRNEIMLEIAE